jgi:flagellar hook-associated protein 1 FlgK
VIDSTDALAAFVSNLENSLIVAGSDPSSDLRLNDVLGSLDALVQKLNVSTASVQSLRQDADAAIAGQVSQLNSNLQRVQTLNTDIQTALSHGLDAAALMDQRQQVVDGISELVPIRVLGRSGGQIAIMSEAGTMLLDGKAAEIGFSTQHTITAETTMTSGGLSGLTVNNVDTPVEKLAGGALSANFELRDETLPAVQADLDAFAADMIARFEQAGVDPTVASGQPSLLTDAGSVLNMADTVGLAGRISINDSIDPEAGGQVWRLRDGVGAAAMGATGDNAQINRWLTALETDLGDGNAASRAADVVSEIGSRRVAAEDTLAQSSARLSGLLEAELSTGVDTDAELQTLLMVEQNYAANARLIQAVEEMMRHLMEI